MIFGLQVSASFSGPKVLRKGSFPPEVYIQPKSLQRIALHNISLLKQDEDIYPREIFNDFHFMKFQLWFIHNPLITKA